MTAPFQVMPDLDPDTYAELREDIREHGITVPVVYDQDDRIIDGHHRIQIADELGIDSDDIPWTVAHVDSDEVGRDLAYRLNAHRRHLNREQKRAALELSLKADPALSDRQHAERVGVSPSTAGAVRAELVDAGAVSNLDTRTDSTGRTQPSTKPFRAPDPRPVETVHLPEPASAEPDPEHDPMPSVEDFLFGQASVQDAMYRAAFTKAVGRLNDVMRFDAERLADLLGDDETWLLDRCVTDLASFNDRLANYRALLDLMDEHPTCQFVHQALDAAGMSLDEFLAARVGAA